MRVWELVNSVERLPLDVSRGQPSGRGRQGLAALVGVLALSTGAVGTFLSANGAGSAALVVGGIALLLFALLGDRLELLKVGNFEFHLREAARELAQRAVDLEAHGDSEAAEGLRKEARHLLLVASPAARTYEDLRVRRTLGTSGSRI